MCIAAGTTVLLAGCGGSGTSGGDETVVAAFYPLAYAAEQVAGPGVDVVDLTRSGQEPHDLELTPRDVARVQDARLVVYVGHGFQPALEDALRGRNGPSLDVLDGIRLHGSGDDVDPHVWLDPRRYEQVAREVATALGSRSRADALVRRLSALDGELRRGLRHCTRRTLVTSHAAFGYFAERYGLRQVALLGLAPDAEPAPRAVGRLADEVRATGATTVFTEPLVSSKLAQTVAREAGARTTTLDPLEVLTPDDEAAGANYFTLMRDNLAVLRKALGCT
ncbi:metal ABC transporter substrate-binding protein [Gaiella sp.]|uniref:metal ABC transporter substrate-binding protein n=1 Tax=Gaiella sp. TaxID=2663207 RepID=UPI002E30AA76|nr:metal ABC transporter substrate-binding protein [Gaiella sp.]HEX5584269.1 metal ABC transporter substrate-binding protein [Gaiella sp.]